MGVLIDTSVLTEVLSPGSEGSRWAQRWLDREPLPVACVSVFEIAFGLQQAAVQALRRGNEPEATQWQMRCDGFAAFIHSESFDVRPYGLDAALVASYLYARLPTPSQARWHRTRGRRKSKTEVRRSWLLDVKIAATAVVEGLSLLTANVGDFEELARVLPPQWSLPVLRFPDQAPDSVL